MAIKKITRAYADNTSNTGKTTGNGNTDLTLNATGYKTGAGTYNNAVKNTQANQTTTTPTTSKTTTTTPTTSNAATTTQAATTTDTTPTYADYVSDYQSDYDKAATAYQQAQTAAPTWDGSQYQAQLDSLYSQIMGYGSFSYDLNSDALYQQYKDQYVRNGQQAMQDTMGQAAALTGGYGSTYATNAGQQSYNSYLQQLNDIVPELYNDAYSKWSDDRSALIDQYSMALAAENQDYNRYQDELSNYYTQLGLAQEAEQTAYDRQQDSKNSLLSQIVNYGYMPTYDQMAQAGFTADDVTYWQNYVDSLNSSSSGGSSSAGSTITDEEKAVANQIGATTIQNGEYQNLLTSIKTATSATQIANLLSQAEAAGYDRNKLSALQSAGESRATELSNNSSSASSTSDSASSKLSNIWSKLFNK